MDASKNNFLISDNDDKDANNYVGKALDLCIEQSGMHM